MANMESRTVEGLLAFSDWLKEKHYLSDSAVEGWKVAIKKVFEAVEGEAFEQFDLTNLDLDEYLDRFQRAAGSAYKTETVVVYGRRIRNAIEAQAYYIEHRKPPAFRGGTRTPENGEGKAKAKPTKAKPTRATSQAGTLQPQQLGELIEFPFPLRTGQMARLHLPPQGLHPKDADRISAFLRTLQYDEQKQIPERTGEDELEVAA